MDNGLRAPWYRRRSPGDILLVNRTRSALLGRSVLGTGGREALIELLRSGGEGANWGCWTRQHRPIAGRRQALDSGLLESWTRRSSWPPNVGRHHCCSMIHDPSHGEARHSYMSSIRTLVVRSGRLSLRGPRIMCSAPCHYWLPASRGATLRGTRHDLHKDGLLARERYCVCFLSYPE